MKTVRIEGMSCMHCAAAVTEAIGVIDGVSEVKVDLENKAAVVEASDTVTDDMLRDAVEDAGYEFVGIE